MRRIGGELIALLVLIPLIVVLGLILVRFGHAPAPTSLPELLIASPSPAAGEDAGKVVGSAVVADTISPIAPSVTLEIAQNGTTKKYSIPVTSEVIVAELLTKAQTQGLQLKTKDYGGSLGLFVEEINGVRNDPATNRYWHLYINNQRSPLGASNALAKLGDTIRWSLEKEHAE